MTEFELINLLTEGCAKQAPDLACGVGDDCAVVAGPAGRDWLITTDLLLQGVHFELGWSDPRSLGKKALSVNLSDIAAMGGAPRFWLASIALPGGMRPESLQDLYRGMHDAAKESGALLIGGDTSSSPGGLMISITAIGQARSSGSIRRSGARPGDAIYVTGMLGGAALGLNCLRSEECGEDTAPFIARHIDPAPRVELGEALAGCGMLTSMIDVSDGLMADLGHIAEASGVGFTVNEPSVPREGTLGRIACRLGVDALALVLGGGEDYELAFTVAADGVPEFESNVLSGLPEPGAVRIGTVEGNVAMRAVLTADGSVVDTAVGGFDHFA